MYIYVYIYNTYISFRTLCYQKSIFMNFIFFRITTKFSIPLTLSHIRASNEKKVICI